jgi:virulence factor Mce-like protein
MRRLALGLAVLLATAIVAVVAAGAGSASDATGTYKIELDNAFGLVTGADFKVSGVKAGTITSIKLNQQSLRAIVTVDVTQGGFGAFHADAFCQSRPQSLIGEYFIDCQPGTSRVHLKGGSVIPVTHTSSTVAPDLVNDIMRQPFRERFSIILNELGAAAAGNGQNLNDAIRRASPALRETDRVLAILAKQNRILGDLVANGDTVINDLANNKHNVQRWVMEARDTAKASAERQRQLAEGFQKLPAFLEQLRPTMAALGDAASAQTPALAKLRDNADQLTRLFNNLGPFADANRPAFKALGKASKTGDKAVKAARPVVAQLNRFSTQTPELANNLAIVLKHLDNRKYAAEKDPRSPGGQGYTGLEALLEYVYDQGMSVNTYDANTHVLKVSLIAGGNCADYAGIKQAKEFGNECSSTLGPNQAGINYEDTTAPPGGNADSRSFRHFDGDPSTQSPVTAPAPPVQIPGGDAGINAAPPIDVPKPSVGNGPQLPQVPDLPKVNVSPTGGAPTDPRTNQALLDYLMGK